jgi:signal transduction histidine kinase
MENAVSGGQNLTQRLLAFSRHESPIKVTIDLAAVVSNVCVLLKHCLPSTIELHSDVAADTGKVEGDPRELETAMLNIALNARDAMPDGGMLKIRACNALKMPGEAMEGDVEPRKFVAISVTDTGHGIPDDVVAHVFDPFFTTKPVGKGTGLGLSQVYSFAKQAGGNVTIESDASSGTTVTMFLPRSDGLMEDAEAVVQIRDRPPYSAANHGPQ